MFSIVTGCLRISKESIFTGTNNFVLDTITDARLDEYFGFTQKDVDKILSDAGVTEYAGQVKEWYDGYHFGECGCILSMGCNELFSGAST